MTIKKADKKKVEEKLEELVNSIDGDVDARSICFAWNKIATKNKRSDRLKVFDLLDEGKITQNPEEDK